jgi:two-component system LytT family response regulator
MQMNAIPALIIDDEMDSRSTLRSYVGKYCSQVQVVGECANIIEARAAILKLRPQLIFLDIEMPHGTAFDLLEQFGEHIDFEIIFITAYSQYAVQAFNLSAAHYLLKPVDIEELEKAVAHVAVLLSQKEQLLRAKILLENMAAQNTAGQNRKLVLPLLEGFDVVRMSDVLYCEAEDNFTCFYFTDGRKSLICRHLKYYEPLLEPFGFCRVHRSHIVNLEYVKRYIKGKGGSVIMEDGREIMVSNQRKDELVRRIMEG